jgi:hypothetical protein
VINDDFVQVGDNVKVNNVNLFLSIIFFGSSSISIPGQGTIPIKNVGLNGTIINIKTSIPYWGMYFAHIIFTLNRKRLSDSNNSRSSSDNNPRQTIINRPNARSYSTTIPRFDSNLVND